MFVKYLLFDPYLLLIKCFCDLVCDLCIDCFRSHLVDGKGQTLGIIFMFMFMIGVVVAVGIMYGVFPL